MDDRKCHFLKTLTSLKRPRDLYHSPLWAAVLLAPRQSFVFRFIGIGVDGALKQREGQVIIIGMPKECHKVNSIF